VPGSPANVDHLVIGPTGLFVIDSKQWTGSIHQGADGLVWHNHYRLDRTVDTVRWEAETVGRLLGTRTAALLCVHGAHVQGGGLHAQGVAIVPAYRTPTSSCSPPPPECGCGRPPDVAASGPGVGSWRTCCPAPCFAWLARLAIPVQASR